MKLKLARKWKWLGVDYDGTVTLYTNRPRAIVSDYHKWPYWNAVVGARSDAHECLDDLWLDQFDWGKLYKRNGDHWEEVQG